jgi:hypothetical protein
MKDHLKEQLMAAAIAQVHLGIAMARSRGVVCGSPSDIRVAFAQPKKKSGKGKKC